LPKFAKSTIDDAASYAMRTQNNIDHIFAAILAITENAKREIRIARSRPWQAKSQQEAKIGRSDTVKKANKIVMAGSEHSL